MNSLAPRAGHSVRRGRRVIDERRIDRRGVEQRRIEQRHTQQRRTEQRHTQQHRTEQRRKRRFIDQLGKGLASSGAAAVLLSVLLLIGFIGKEIVPLLLPMKLRLVEEIAITEGGAPIDYEELLAIGTDEYQERLFLLGRDGTIHVADLASGVVTDRVRPEHSEGPVDGLAVDGVRPEHSEGSVNGLAVDGLRPEDSDGPVNRLAVDGLRPEHSDGPVNGLAVDGLRPEDSEGPVNGLAVNRVRPEDSDEPLKSAVFDRVRFENTVDAADGSPSGVAYVSAKSDPLNNRVIVGTDDGRVQELRLTFPVRFERDERVVGFQVEAAAPLLVDPDRAPLVAADLVTTGRGLVAVGITKSNTLHLVTHERKASLFGPGELVEHRFDLTESISGRVSAVALAPDGLTLVAGTSGGLLYQWDLRNPSAPALLGAFPANKDGAAITALAYLIGGESLVVGDAAGRVSTWFPVADTDNLGGGRLLRQVHIHAAHRAAVERIAVSQRNRTFLTSDALGGVAMHHSTSEQTFYQTEGKRQSNLALAIAPKNDGKLILTPRGVELWSFHNPHPEVTLQTAFGRVHYEGYPQEEFVWQSTGGTDAFESKMSLVPLIFGTLKGTVYALLFAVPLGVMAAVYTAYFMGPRLQALVKPTIELMAGLPSVILGFLAGLWLAPRVATHLAGWLCFMVLLPVMTLGSAWLWRKMPVRYRARMTLGEEALLVIPVIALAWSVAMRLGSAMERSVMAGDISFWFFDVFGLPFEQRNSLIVGMAMGFAVIPVIFSLAEDALSSVPQALSAGSLALGATRWQTVRKVVVPAALPGIVSAILMGIGRAAGETMIVLMATGNTPIMEWNPFTGFRTLAANIAVEMPEAPVGGTLYRMLFVAAALLFLFTMLLNTLGEVIRLRMKRRLGAL